MRMPHQYLLFSNNEFFFRLQTFPLCVSFGVGWGGANSSAKLQSGREVAVFSYVQTRDVWTVGAE